MTVGPAREAAPFRKELRDRRVAAIAVRALREAGIESIDELYAMPRYDLLRLPGVGPLVFDYVNSLLNAGDVERLSALFDAAHES